MEESLARKSLLSTVMNLLGAVIAYAGFFFIARLWHGGPVEGETIIGLITFSTGYVSVFLPVSRLGFATAHTKKVSEGADLAECNGAFMLITAVLSLAMIATVFASLFLWVYIFHKGFQTQNEVAAIWIMLGYTVLVAVSGIPVTTFNARREIMKGQLGTFMGHIVRVTAIIVVVVASLASIDIIWAYFLGALASLITSIVYFRNYPIKWPSRSIISEYRKFADPLFFPSLISPLPISLAPVLIQLFWFSDFSATGYFGSAYRIVVVLATLGTSVGSVIFPKLSELHSQGKGTEIVERTANSEKLLSFVLAPFTFFVVIYASGVIYVLLAKNFLPAVPTMMALAIYIYILGVTSPKSSLIPALNRPRLSGAISIMSSIVTIALLLILIPTSIFKFKLFGLKEYGAAIALAAGAAIAYIATNYYSSRIAGTKFEFRLLAYPLVSIVACLAFMPLTSVFPVLEWTWYIGLMFVLGSVLLYVLLCLVMRIIKMDDIKLLVDSVNPFAMHRYIASELSTTFQDEIK